ncbi:MULTISPECIES: M1 family metallopeptidase [unclassified Sphingomonas]|uniref:M1 family metallopeptidase n=1 Tax=Sphingomonas TaxID=13687 RepID=UPI000966776C|nr:MULTISPECIES: M1 family metallopeptidase [unclassified Sphingomonas]MBN8811712.1 M1 family metallopeptidase [Sphingomonas sp.]OJY52692.1 MAG: aminopeptidase [Sphingomonas sp. 67-41]
MRILPALAAAIVIAAPAAAQTGKPAPILTTPEAKDAWTHAVPEVARVTHVDLNLDVDFAGKTLSGVATLDVLAAAGAKEVVLDVDDLDVISVTCPKGKPLPFAIGPRDKELGSALTVQLEGNKQILIRYKTRPGASALQWLAPELTAGKRKPYLFSQGQPINNRSWIPTQDSPGIRQTWSATLTVPAGLVAVMSGDRLDGEKGQAAPDGRRRFRFRMDKPVPPYLVAMAVGDLAFKATGKRSGVWTEPSMLDAAAHEVGDVEKMIDAAQALYGPYRWGRYDMLVLPPSFPYGGMENPTLTFLTPTIITGDRSNTDVVAHELAHSWSGNLVTNATWSDSWLNEGFTTYFENRIMEAVYGKERAAMYADLDWDGLQRDIRDAGGGDAATTRLHGDPGATFGQLDYFKGSTFLRTIEAAVGRAKWDAYLRAYFDRHAFQPQTTTGFLADLRANLIRGDKALEAKLELDRWAYRPGLPDNAVHVTSATLAAVDAKLAAFNAGGPASAVQPAGWATQQWLRFLNGLPRQQPPARLAELDGALGLSTSNNAYVRSAWAELAIANRYEPALPGIEEFVKRVGRGLLIYPIYKDLMAQGDWGKPIALRFYEGAKAGYHPNAAAGVAKIVGAE